MDFTSVISVINGFSIVAAVSAVAALKIFPYVAQWAYNQIFRCFEDYSSNLLKTTKTKKGGGVRSGSVHPAFLSPENFQLVPVMPESNLDSDSRFKVFGAIFGFFGDFFVKFFSFFRLKKFFN